MTITIIIITTTITRLHHIMQQQMELSSHPTPNRQRKLSHLKMELCLIKLVLSQGQGRDEGVKDNNV
jgi:hypothetical protein